MENLKKAYIHILGGNLFSDYKQIKEKTKRRLKCFVFTVFWHLLVWKKKSFFYQASATFYLITPEILSMLATKRCLDTNITLIYTNLKQTKLNERTNEWEKRMKKTKSHENPMSDAFIIRRSSLDTFIYIYMDESSQ